MIRCIVAGSRTFRDRELLYSKLDFYLQNQPDAVTISGGAKGADKLGEEYARDRALRCLIIPADWNRHGKAAGPIRNEEMAQVATHAVIFWDGQSRGSADMVQRAIAHNLKLRVVQYADSQQKPVQCHPL